MEDEESQAVLKAVGRQIKMWREAAGMTQEAVLQDPTWLLPAAACLVFGVRPTGSPGGQWPRPPCP